MKLADRMLARVGKTRADVSPSSRSGRLFRRAGVRDTEELSRIVALPRRDWREGVEEWQDLFTEAFKRPGGTMRLRPIQAVALKEAHDNGGALLMIQVSGGKTLLSFLLPEVMEVERPLLLIPAGLRGKTDAEWWAYQKNWKLPKLRIEHYELLSREQHAEYLFNYKPDLIIADEGHRLKDPKAAVTRRVSRYLAYQASVGEGVPVVIMSGTVTNRRLNDYWHILKWTHGEEDMPMPSNWAEMTEWSECMDVTAKAIKMAPGALTALFNEEESRAAEEGDAIQATRSAYQRRLTDTPGVIASSTKGEYGGSLFIRAVDPLHGDSSLDDLFLDMRRTWETPDGHPFTQAVDLWRHARELACGFYYVWDPRPPKDWLHARKTWYRFVREVLKHSHVYDTPLQVAKAASLGNLITVVEERNEETGKLVGIDVYRRWKHLEHNFKPRTVAKWVSKTTLNFAAAWMKRGPGIVWVEHDAFGLALADLAGRPYFGQGGVTSTGETIEGANGPVIASVHANRQGRNLQQWNRALVISELPNGGKWQQLLARHHRDGQQADEVTFDVCISSVEQWAGFMSALRDARYIQESTGDHQKLLMADITMPSADEVAEMTDARWTKISTADGGG